MELLFTSAQKVPLNIYISNKPQTNMSITEKDVKRMSLIVLILILAVLVYLIIKPVLIAIIAGLLLAYIFSPVYKWIVKKVKYPTLAAALVSVIVLAIIFVPLWFLLPTMSQQVFEFFQQAQGLDVNTFIRNIFPSASEQFIAQTDATLNNTLTKVTSLILDSLVDLLINFAIISLHLLIVAFIFFYALRDKEKLKEFTSSLSPLNKLQQKRLVQQFKDMTGSIINGQIIAGVVQGILAGIALYVFGVPHALLFTILAIIVSIIPIIGPSIVYFPVTIYLLLIGNPLLAVGYLLFNVLIVSSVDTFIRAHIVSRKTKVSQSIVLVGMIGGLFIFGIFGLILGPLILTYFLTFLNAYRKKELSSLFAT